MPAGWSMNPPPENNDGRRFRSPDGKAGLTIYGGYVAYDVNSEISPSGSPGWQITYSRIGRDWAVASGFTNDGMIFYTKRISACNGTIINTTEITYPESRQQEFEPIVNQISRSFHNAPVSDECSS